jgi:hypothetical protein
MNDTDPLSAIAVSFYKNRFPQLLLRTFQQHHRSAATFLYQIS